MNRTFFIFLSILLLTNIVYGQDTIRLQKKPNVILRSWYPEYKDFPKLKIGEAKVLFTIINDFDSLNRNDIDLKTNNNDVQIKETGKENQYLVKVNSNYKKYIELELWLDLEDKIVLINLNGKWKNITEVYKTDNNKILIETVKLAVEK